MKLNTIVNKLQTKMKYFLIFSACLVSQAATAMPVFEFGMTGNTVYKPFSISNLSTSGEFINAFTLDITGLGYVFDTIDNDGGTRYSKALSPNSGTGAVTGLLSSSGAVENSTFLRVFFSNFNAGETFLFDIDVDLLGDARSPVYGNELIGSMLTVEFSDGMVLSGLLGGVDGKATSTSLNLNGSDFALTVNSPTTLSLFALIPLMFMANRSKKRQSTK